MNKQFHIYGSRILLSLLITMTPCTVNAVTPSEMADLSLQELFALSTDDIDEPKFEHWNINFLYKASQLDGYLMGNDKVSNSEVLFDGNETRTQFNFPILPTVIKQETYLALFSYHLDNDQNISVSLPYIVQSTDHDSIIPGYDTFNISSDGLGDITVNYGRLITRWGEQSLSASIGISIPTGSIDEKGDTPREHGDQQLPYTMQLGSGTWDFPLGLTYAVEQEHRHWGINLFAKLRLGNNDREYRLGNRAAASIWHKWKLEGTFHPFVKLVYQHWGKIRGQDNEITVPVEGFPYPAGITNPRFYGGTKANFVIGTDIIVRHELFNIEIGKPIYQYLNGVQPKENLHFSFSWNKHF